MSRATVWTFTADSSSENRVTVHESRESAAVLARAFVREEWPDSLGPIPEDLEVALRVLGENADAYGRIESHVPLTVEEAQAMLEGGGDPREA